MSQTLLKLLRELFLEALHYFLVQAFNLRTDNFRVNADCKSEFHLSNFERLLRRDSLRIILKLHFGEQLVEAII